MIDCLLEDLAACLCAELTPDGATGPGFCFCGVMPGLVVADDYMWGCKNACGMAWTRLAAAYPAEGVGVPAENPQGCGTTLGMDIEIGVRRCLKQQRDGQPPSADSMAQAAAIQFADMLAMRRAIACCESLSDLDYALTIYQPEGPRGMIVGGTWTLSVLVM